MSECSDLSDSDYEPSEAHSSTHAMSEVMEPVTHIKARVEISDDEKTEVLKARQKKAARIRGTSKRSILFKQAILLGWPLPCNKSTIKKLREFIIKNGEEPNETNAKGATERQLKALAKARATVQERKKKYGTLRIKTLHKEIYRQRRKQMLQKRLFDLQKAILEDDEDDLDITILEEKPEPKRYRKPTGRPRGRPRKVVKTEVQTTPDTPQNPEPIVSEQCQVNEEDDNVQNQLIDKGNDTVVSRKDNLDNTETKTEIRNQSLIPPKPKLKRQAGHEQPKKEIVQRWELCPSVNDAHYSDSADSSDEADAFSASECPSFMKSESNFDWSEF